MPCLRCSGWDAKHRHDFIIAGLTGFYRQVKTSDSGVTPLYRPWDWNREERDRKKLVTKVAWYRPNDAVMFVPGTPSSELRNTLQKIANKNLSQLGMSLRVVETSGRKIKDSLVRLDLTGCFYGEDRCRACKSGLKGASHTRSGVQYYVTCKVCATTNIMAEYHGESGFSAVHRLAQHEDDIKHKRKKNAMAKHLDTYHQDKVGDPDSFVYSSVATFKKRLERQISEGVAIMKSNAEVSEDRQNRILMNLKNEHRSLQPAVHSTTVTRQTGHGS